MSIIYVTNGGVKIWTIATGRGVPVILCNGGPGCCDYLAPVAHLIDQSAYVIRFEQRGCGRSDHDDFYDVDTCVQDLEAIRRHYGMERWIVAGHSWGADLALAYALAHPQRVLGIVCIAGGRINNNRDWARVYHERKEQEGEAWPEYDYPVNFEVNRQVNASWRQYIQKPDLLKAFANLDAPTLFVYGEKDIRPSWPIEQLANLMPNAIYKNIKGANHYIWDTHAPELKTYLKTFIREYGDSHSPPNG